MTELSNLDLESSTDDNGSENETGVEKTEIEEPVPVEESEKEDMPEKDDSKEEVDNAATFESISTPKETECSVDEQKIDDNENQTRADDEEAQEHKSSEQESTDSTMELYRPEDVSKAQVSISTFEPGSSRWEAYSNSSLHSSRSSLDSSRSQDPVPPDPALPRGPPETDQSIVPQLLIDHNVSMIDPSRAQTVDNDIARHCAFSLPAVALTLGRTNWPLLKETYESLANDMQWKVRRTLASSIHELGVILGEDVASTDLVPIFNGFLKDLDEVRIGLLKHLADFLKLLKHSDRKEYLPRLPEFLKMDNERNWRFREELAEQLGHLVKLFTPEEVK